MARAFPEAHPVCPTTAWTRTAMSWVRWSMPATPTVRHVVGVQETLAVVTARAVIVPLPEVYDGTLMPVSSRMTSEALSVLTSSTVNCTQARVTVAPGGTGTPVNRSPTTCL